MIDNNPEWVFPGVVVERVAESLMRERSMPYHYAIVLANRGINSFKEAENFVAPSLDDLRDPFLFTDMRKAVERLKKALGNGEHVMVYGDYDVDGVCGTALFMRIISSLGARVSYHSHRARCIRGDSNLAGR